MKLHESTNHRDRRAFEAAPLTSNADKVSTLAFTDMLRGPCREPLFPECLFPAALLLLLPCSRPGTMSILNVGVWYVVSACGERSSWHRRDQEYPSIQMPLAQGMPNVACLRRTHRAY